MSNAKLIEDALKALKTFDRAAIAYSEAVGTRTQAAQYVKFRLYRAAKLRLERAIIKLAE